MNINTNELHPKFIEALDNLQAFSEKEKMESTAAQRWLDQAIFFAPQQMKDMMYEKAKELGLIPESEYCLENGEQVFSSEQLSKYFGIPIEEVERKIEELNQRGCVTGVSGSQVFRKQLGDKNMTTQTISIDQTIALIPVFQAEIGGILTNACDARLMHGFLAVGKDFSSWIKLRIKQYGFTQDVDFKAHQKGGSLETTTYVGDKIEYTLTLNMGKELSMVEKNDKGRQARKYFINCERLAIETLTANAKTPYSLTPLPLKPTKKAVEGGLSLETQDELKKMVDDLAFTLPKDQQVSAIIGMWGALNTYFGTKALKGGSKLKLAGYKFIPEASRLECVSLLARLPFNDLMTLSSTEMNALVDSRVQEQLKALPAPAPLAGEVMPTNSITLTINKLEAYQRLLITQSETGLMVINPTLTKGRQFPA